MQITTGRTVFYTLGSGRQNKGLVRPGVVLYPITMEGRIKLRVFADDDPGDFLPDESVSSGTFVVEAEYDQMADEASARVRPDWYQPGTWHWPPKAP